MTQETIPSGIDQVLLYLNLLYSNAPDETLIGLSTIKKGDRNLETYFFKTSETDRLVKRIASREDKYNVFLRVPPLTEKPESGRGDAKLSAGTQVLWSDIDSKDHTAVIDALQQLAQPPTAIINSGYGIHAYWLLSSFETNLTQIKVKNHGLKLSINRALGIDDADSVFDLARVMRVPGTYNVKNGSPKPVQIIFYDPTRIYTINEFPDAELEETPINIDDVPVAELPIDFLDSLREKDKKLVGRILNETSAIKAGCDLTDDDEIDYSRNDAYIATRLLALGYGVDVALAVLSHETWLSGEKYRRTLRWDYVLTTVEKAFAHWQKSPDRFGKGRTFRADLVAESVTQNQPIIYVSSRFYYYADGVYIQDNDNVIKNRIVTLLGKHWTLHAQEEILGWLKAMYTVPVDQVSQHFGLVNCTNGMLDARTGELLPHDPKYLSLAQLPVTFNPDANTDEVDTFFAQLLPADSINPFWEYIGSAFLGNHYWPKKFMVLVGPPHTGKSKILEILSLFYGLNNTQVVDLQTLADNRFARADLFGQIANIFDELNESEAQNIGPIKNITGDGLTSGERKYGDRFKFKNVARLIFSANHYPAVRSPDEAFFERALIIPCRNQFIGASADPRIVERLTTPANLSAVLLRATQGLQRLLINGVMSESPSIDAECREYRLSADTVFGFFHDVTTPDVTVAGVVTKQLMFKYYERWCHRANRYAFSSDKFFKRVAENLKALGLQEEYRTIENDQRWCYVGRRVTMKNEPLVFSN